MRQLELSRGRIRLDVRAFLYSITIILYYTYIFFNRKNFYAQNHLSKPTTTRVYVRVSERKRVINIAGNPVLRRLHRDDRRVNRLGTTRKNRSGS